MILSARYDFEPLKSHRPSPHAFVRTTDGDTLVIEQALRLVSCDTPEKSYAGDAENTQRLLDECRRRLECGFYAAIPEELREYLIAKLTGDAAERHLRAAEEASVAFSRLLERRLRKRNGTQRRIAILPTHEALDAHGRMLAYIAPWFGGGTRDPLPPRSSRKRRTLNLDMIERGFASFFPIFPSLPNADDMQRAVRAADRAWREKRGVWKTQGENVLLGYELRMCIKLARAERPAAGVADAFQRGCLDLRTMANAGRFGFGSIPPSHRLWYWNVDANEALSSLGAFDRWTANPSHR